MKFNLRYAIAGCAGLLAALGIPTMAEAANLVVNGGFETGDFTGWDVTTNGIGGCDTNWNVGTTGTETGCSSVDSPIEGSFAAYSSFDGAGPQSFILSQDILLSDSVESATLSWLQAVRHTIFVGEPRTFSVNINGTAIDTQSFSGFGGDGSWTEFSIDATDALSAFAGETVTLSFEQFIPDSFSGPAGFGLDAVSLDVVGGPSDAIPEPLTILGSALALGLGGATRKFKNKKQ